MKFNRFICERCPHLKKSKTWDSVWVNYNCVVSKFMRHIGQKHGRKDFSKEREDSAGVPLNECPFALEYILSNESQSSNL